MLYERAIDITDTYGRFDADPVMFRARAVPRLEISIETVAAALDDMVRVGLIERWEVDGNPYAYIVDFEKYNKLDSAKEAQTRIPGPDGVVPKRDRRTDRPKPKGKPKTSPKADQGEPVDDPLPAPETPRAGSGQELGTPRVDPGQELGTLDGYGYGDEEVLGDGSSKNVLSQSVMSAGADVSLDDLIEIWNADCGNLRSVRDRQTALANPELKRLAAAFVKRHGGEKALALFKAGIAAVRDDPHWLGSKAAKPTRTTAAYGILGYLRHVEEKAEAAADTAEAVQAQPPPRPWRPRDIADNRTLGRVGHVAEVYSDGTALMTTGDTWNLSECVRCNN